MHHQKQTGKTDDLEDISGEPENQMMSPDLLTPGATEYVGVAAGHTIGLVIANPDPSVRLLLEIPDQYASIAILSSRVGAAAQAFAVDEAVKSAQADLLRFELPRDTEGYSGHGNLFVLGCPDISDARRVVELALARIDENAERIYINEVGHMEMHYTAHAGVILHQLFDAPLHRAFGFICAGPAGISIVAADNALKAAPVEACWYGTASYRLSMTNEVIVGITGDYSAVKKAVDTAYQTASSLMEVHGSKPESILQFKR